MIKTKLFVKYKCGTTLESVFEYEKFIRLNQNIDIISVNVVDKYYILLTYRVEEE